jgi:hypothetical protein
MNDVSRHHVERTAAEALAATVPASRAGVEALVGYLRDLERSLPQNSPDLYDAMPDGFEAAVRQNIRLAGFGSMLSKKSKIEQFAGRRAPTADRHVRRQCGLLQCFEPNLMAQRE